MTEARKGRLLDVLSKRQGDLTVVLENVIDPHNISAVMRTCDAVGVQDLHVLNTRAVRPKNWGFKSSSSASKWISVHHHESVQGCFTRLRENYSRIICADATDDSVDLFATDLKGSSVAIVFGNELEGVSEEARLLADGLIRIPQVGVIHSLNVSVACAVVLYEAYRQKEAAGHYQRDDSIHGRLLDEWNLIDGTSQTLDQTADNT